LGSNDAGGCLVSLLATFVHFMPMKPYNIVIVASAEEENSGKTD
jgi:acetylornithine deacetylase